MSFAGQRCLLLETRPHLCSTATELLKKKIAATLDRCLQLSESMLTIAQVSTKVFHTYWESNLVSEMASCKNH